MTMYFTTINQLRRAANRRAKQRGGESWFSPQNMRDFGTVILFAVKPSRRSKKVFFAYANHFAGSIVFYEVGEGDLETGDIVPLSYASIQRTADQAIERAKELARMEE
jgi:hypothetical protein